MKKFKKSLNVMLAALMLFTAFLGVAPVKAADVLPTVAFVGVEHSPLVVGEKESFFLTSNYTGQVQYDLFINKEGSDEWTNISGGYTSAVDAKTPFEFKYDKAFELGKYSVAVRVKKAGTEGVNSNKYGKYDTAYGFQLNCVDKDNANRVYSAGKLVVDKEKVVVGETVTIGGIDNISGMKAPYTYKLHAYNATKDTWEKDITGFVAKPTWTPKEAGTYVLDVWATSSDSTAPYESWKLKVITVVDKETAAQEAAEKAVAALEKAAKADLTVEANAKTAQDALKAAQDAVAKVTDTAKKADFAKRVDAAKAVVEYATKLNTATGKVVAFEKAVTDLTTQAKIDAATSASVISLDGLKDENAVALTIRIDAAKATLTYGKKLFSTSSQVVALETAVTDLSTQEKIDAATSASVISLDGLKDADKAGFQTRIDAAKAKIADAQAKLDASKGIALVSKVEALQFGGRITITCAYPSAVKYQVFNADGSIVTNATDLGTAAMIYPAKKDGDKVTVKLLDATGAVLVTKEVTLGTDAMIAKPGSTTTDAAVTVKVTGLQFGAKLTVTTDSKDAAKFQVFNADGSIVTNATAFGTDAMIYPAKKAGDKVTVKLLDAAGAVLQSVEATIQ